MESLSTNQEKLKQVINKYMELTWLIREKTPTKTTIEIYEISQKIYHEIKSIYPAFKIVDKIDEAKKIFNENPYKYIDNKKFEIEI
jgi:hypothetical protein